MGGCVSEQMRVCPCVHARQRRPYRTVYVPQRAQTCAPHVRENPLPGPVRVFIEGLWVVLYNSHQTSCPREQNHRIISRFKRDYHSAT